MSSEALTEKALRPEPDLSGRIQSIDSLRALALLLIERPFMGSPKRGSALAPSSAAPGGLPVSAAQLASRL